MAAPTYGREWLYNFLYDKGLRGNDLRIGWVLGMREGGGDPGNVTNGSMAWNWNDDGIVNGVEVGPFYDVGLFQINNRHLATVQSRYNGDMRKMFDVDKNYDMFLHLSQNLTYLLDWALEPDGKTFNWSIYPSDWVSQYAAGTESNHAVLWSDFKKWDRNKFGDSHNGWPILKWGDPRLLSKTVPSVISRPALTMRKEVLPLFLSFVSDFNAKVLNISGSPDEVSFSSVIPVYTGSGTLLSNLRSGTAVILNSRGSGMSVNASHAYYKYWLNNSTLRTKVSQLLDSYGVIHWGGPEIWGGKTPNAGASTVYNNGLYYLKPSASLSDVAEKIEALGISSSGKRKNPLPNGPS